MAVESVTDYITKEVLPTTAYTVIYFDDNEDDKVTDKAGGSLDQAEGIDASRFGSAPNSVGNYIMKVYKGTVDTSAFNGDETASTVAATTPNVTVKFRIDPETVSLDEAFAYEPAQSGDSTADVTFAYRGKDVSAAFAVGDKKIDLTNVNVVWTQYPTQNVPTASDSEYTLNAGTGSLAGTYTAKLTAKAIGECDAGHTYYAGSTTVTFEVAPIDLTQDEITIAPTDSLAVSNTTAAKVTTTNQVYVNGEALEADLSASIGGALVAIDGKAATDAPAKPIEGTAHAGTYTFKFEDLNPDNADVVGGPITVDAEVVNAMVEYRYKGVKVDDVDGIDINLGYGDVLNTDFLSAVYGDDEKAAEFSWKLTDANGNEVSPADIEDGEYSLYLETGVFTMADADGVAKTYAGYEKVAVDVTGPNYDGAVAFILVDEKLLNDGSYQEFPYTGSAYEPAVVAKNGDDTLVEGTDYTVEVTKDGEAVESIVDLGEYDVTVKFADNDESNWVVGKMKVGKAPILSVEPAADFFSTDGETAAVPAFVGSTEADFDKGQKFDLAADEVSVAYYGVNGTGTEYDPYVKNGSEPIKASELTEEGWYWADVTVLTTAAHVKTAKTVGTAFQVLEKAVFADVPADAWYAEYVYKASNERYMNGVAKGIFAPEQPMQRSEFARVVFNMAGNVPHVGVEYPTQFADVPANAWYAEAVEWASRYNIVTGTSATTFDPTGTITREQIATMLYRYAGNGAQADLSVLDQFEDADSISDWAKNAMAWAVEEGYMNGKGENNLDPQGTALRCEIAKLAVMVQPEAL